MEGEFGIGESSKKEKKREGEKEGRDVKGNRSIGHSKDKEEEDLGTAARKDREKP